MCGSFFDGFGQAQGLTARFHRLDGTMSWAAVPDDDSWLARDWYPNLDFLRLDRDELGSYRALQGSIGNLDVEIEVLLFDGVRQWTASLGDVCELEPSGTIQVRTAQGLWLEVVFDGPFEPKGAFASSLCDGCGTMWHNEVSLGPVCVDFAPLLNQYVGVQGVTT